ncbi:tRNA (adenosine(37)-N6)-threonylcarbamoyltransferase complex dimerization subunit type 1 TsaB [Roseibium aquae]|uniref:tRNA (Adenosine(37)-N6)-threonylcarbamoyltransferase complex dimerization subunit type 1 TsaB n=1 Tax=Roseibium aquae TaxID=1323746 RepID=A0A916TJW1_9HYPH|nr:tRNA (adenosine(37)-N6)-threonylcarbamoyltransferase complex dimerization subunit type 1 TsaB [Roseibium aquae]GGB47873.1 tRNA (adenosine(37)-N6)-threonylcarbamoyltransferase complex dimerization subunit type 1 TsaB [Roseibium aquae]
MRVLAIDTALANCAAAVLDDSTVPVCLAECGAVIGRGHAERLMVMISNVMADSSTAFVDLDRIVVTTGPGSFTGLRVGLSVARGFGVVLGKPVVGVTTLEALAHSVAGGSGGHPVLVALEGKKDEVYCQHFAGDGTAIEDAQVRTVQSLTETLPADIRLAGSAAQRIAEACRLPSGRILSSTGYAPIQDVALLGMSANPELSMPVPLYLRPPDATPARDSGIARQ